MTDEGAARPDWLETELWNFAHAAAIELGLDNGIGPTSPAEDVIYRNMRMVCRMYASSSNAALVKQLEWVEGRRAQVEVWMSELGAEIRALRDSRDRLQEALKQVLCPHPKNRCRGGNDYLQCADCELEWDWRFKAAPEAARDNAEKLLARAALGDPERKGTE